MGGSPELTPPRLVGRDRELAHVRRWLAAVETGRGGVLVLHGDAGLGKTRLVQEIARAAQARGMVVKASEASELQRTRPFGAISDALGVSLRSADPALAGLARRIEGHQAWPGPLEDVPVEVHNLVEALTGVFESLCTTAELLLVIDNLHWVDSSSLAVLRRLIRLGRQYPVLIVATTRPTDQQPVVALVDAARQGGGAVLDLGPLDPESVLALAGQLAGARRGRAWRTGWRRPRATRCSSSSSSPPCSSRARSASPKPARPRRRTARRRPSWPPAS